MSVTYGFYNSLNGDRKYNAKQISELFDGLIRDGVFMSIGDALVVSVGGGMNITVGTGRAWFNHTWTYNDAPLILQVEQSEIVLNRVDSVVLEVNSDDNVRANTIKIVKGVPSSEPVATELVRNEFVNQYPLAYIYVSAGVTEITAANITNTVGTSDCPFVTGILETVDIDTLLTQWDGEFHDWMQQLEDILDEDTAGNLLNLIEAHKAEDATTSVKGHVQLSDAINSTSTILGATANAVKTAYDKADEKMDKSGGEFTGITKAHSNTSYTTKQIRNIILSPDNANVSLMADGDIWMKYK